jgi:hypothetical protein
MSKLLPVIFKFHVRPTDKAFRHGDIENVLESLVKSAGGAAGSGLLGIAQSVISNVAGGAKFTKSDVKKVYFVSFHSPLEFSACLLKGIHREIG